MTNALQLNSSVPFAGLGAAAYTLPVAGLYTLDFKTFLPYLAAGSPPQSTSPSNYIQDITAVADSAGSLNSTYWIFYSAGNLYGYYVWYNINSAGVDPAPAGLIGIQVAGATSVTANNLAAATRTAIAAAVPSVTVTGATSHIILNSNNPGTTTAAANSAGATPGFSYSVTAAGSYGAPAMSGLNAVITQNSTVLSRCGFPSPTQPILNGRATFLASANDVIAVTFSSLSTADAALNAVKSVITLFGGE